MSYEETHRATKDGVTEAMSAMPKPMPKLMSISPFEARDEDGDDVRAVGIKLDDEDDFTFVVVVTESDGGMYVATRDALYPTTVAAA